MSRRFSIFDMDLFNDPAIQEAWSSFDRLFTALGSSQSFPPYNIYALKDGSAQIEFAVAGYDQSEITVTAVDGKLVVSGAKKEDKEDNEDCKCAYRGIHGSKFKVSVPLETRFDLSKTEAKMKNGMLIVTVPLAEERKARTVDIKIG